MRLKEGFDISILFQFRFARQQFPHLEQIQPALTRVQ
jgi:hypothetical protein